VTRLEAFCASLTEELRITLGAGKTTGARAARAHAAHLVREFLTKLDDHVGVHGKAISYLDEPQP
jgi:hypothetical protein